MDYVSSMEKKVGVLDLFFTRRQNKHVITVAVNSHHCNWNRNVGCNNLPATTPGIQEHHPGLGDMCSDLLYIGRDWSLEPI